MARHDFSRTYDNAPMPHAIFFHDGFAIQGTTDISRLGGAAASGLHPAILFAPVEREGARNSRIEMSNRAA